MQTHRVEWYAISPAKVLIGVHIQKDLYCAFHMLFPYVEKIMAHLLNCHTDVLSG